MISQILTTISKKDYQKATLNMSSGITLSKAAYANNSFFLRQGK